MAADLNTLREQVDALDAEIQRLVAARADVARQIGAAKRASGDTVHHPQREAEILARIAQRNDGPLTDAEVQGIFERLIVACRELQQRDDS